MMNYGLIGKKLAHSYSEIIHKKLGNPDYRLCELDESKVGEFLTQRPFKGINITVPYKKTAFSASDILSDEARAIGSVNTAVVDRSGRLCGYNTDAFGFEYLLSRAGINPAGRRCIILGSGGSSVTVNYVLKKLGAFSVTVISRSGPDNYENIGRHHNAEIIVNTTPVGMYPGNGSCPVKLADFCSCVGVLDIIYNPSRTALLLDADELGIPSANGLPMLVAQAVRADSIFFDRAPDTERDTSVTEDIIAGLERDERNILLVGMPGCGKSTVGALLAKRTGRAFIDTDAEIIREAGLSMSIPEIFAKEGEAGFRQREHAVLSRVSKESGIIIATGGGSLTVPGGVCLARQNSNVFFINRPLDGLDTAGRPLSKPGALETLFEARLPLYRAAADFEIPFCSSEQTASEILAYLKIK